jgi:transcriptional regulator with XRE-family HTH domain
MMTFAERLKAEREAGGWTQVSLAEASGVPAGTIRDLEQKKRRPLLDTAYRLAKALGVSLDVLADEEAPSLAATKRGRPPKDKTP